MNLLVNVVIEHWQIRSTRDRIKAMNCLKALLQFISEEDAPKYLTQIMSMVNKAMATSSSQMQYIATCVLSNYVRLLLKENIEIVGSNLTNIVVSLFPVLEPTSRPGHGYSGTNNDESSDGKQYVERSIEIAKELLEYLTADRRGKKLAPYFREIPFLPPSTALAKARSSLKANGIDVDDVLVMTQISTQNTQGLTGRESIGNTGIRGSKSSKQYSASAQAALRRRLGILGNILSHQNKEVRIAVLRHLTDLLRANRSLFLRLVESEESVSLRFLTVINEDLVNSDGSESGKTIHTARDIPSAGKGGVTTIVQQLVSRCVIEEDKRARLALATCLGEMGAIDPHRLGREVNATPASLLANDSFDVCGYHGTWRLSQSPWQSQVIRYELHIVSTVLVVALKSAQVGMEQHKVAFTIQSLLKLLDDSAKFYGGKSQDESDQEAGNEMSAWLSEKLDKAGVKSVLEPFWRTNYMQKDTVAARKPPFFSKASSYFSWLQLWCRYMVWRSQENERSRWRSFFYACRSAIRADATICEFLLPLLVLDSLCFGDQSDEKVVLREMTDALSFGSNSESDLQNISRRRPTRSQMALTDRQKAANTIFVVLDTLSIWAERETEDRYLASSRSSSQSSLGKNKSHSMTNLDGVGTVWPADESLIRIEDLLKAIPLSTCAKAAEAVGMNARCLRYLEMEARSQIAVSVYDDLKGDAYATNDGKNKALLGETILNGIDIGLMQRVLGRLDDCDTMAFTSKDSSQLSRNIIDNINERELRGDWAGSLHMYEQALQLDQWQDGRSDQLTLKSGMMKSLLHLGQLESVINQTAGILSKDKNASRLQNKKRLRQSSYDMIDDDASKLLLPSAAEAAWRLGQWDTLDNILDSWDKSTHREIESESSPSRVEVDPEGRYDVSFSRAMLGLHTFDEELVTMSIKEARNAVLLSLSGAARESYSRAYPYLLNLQCIREIEDASGLMRNENSLPISFSDLAQSESAYGWDWDGRLRMTGSKALGSSAVMNVRLALTRIFDERVMEGGFWLKEGKRARKRGLFHIAEHSLAHADAALDMQIRSGRMLDPIALKALQGHCNDVKLQYAKLNFATGKSTGALRLLGQENLDIKGLLEQQRDSLRKAVTSIQRPEDGRISIDDEDACVKMFGRCLLTGTEWIHDGGLKSGSEVIDRYKLVSQLLPDWERGHFCYAKYLDALLESRVKALSGQIGKGNSNSQDDDAIWAKMMRCDEGCQRYLLLAMKEYGEALKLGQKHIFQALPRLLSLWFDFTSLDPNFDKDAAASEESKTRRRSRTSKQNEQSGDNEQERMSRLLKRRQAEANSLMERFCTETPPVVFYTALPQLISRVGHRNTTTANVVTSILKRVLTKFPQQAMWSLAWLRNSANSSRARTGDEIFKSAERALRIQEDIKNHDLLSASRSLFKFLIDLAKYNPKNTSQRTLTVRPWKSDVELMEFVPPVQAALSVIPSTLGQSSSRENFPAFVPRMRAFCSTIQVMASKARPKKLTAFAIPAGQNPKTLRASSSSYSRSQPGDAGEMHFLVKREAKGDLRKDARVQDLNNVINRLLSEHGMNSNGNRQRRRLRLRTFSVICLSEDCGILEWVPNTDSFRNLVCQSYNPQAQPHSSRRRGRRIGNFADISLRNNYQKCQDMYFKHGNLTRASEMFEETILKPYPPVLYWWFMQKFLDPHAWFEARMAFTLSAATWSAVGHVIGLGDRHSENILVDTSSGDCVHVDFDCIFDKGLLLPRPEVVPFRLTPNMLDAFGPIGAEGAFTGGLTAAMTTLRDNRELLLSVLEPFLKDPIIEWKRHRSEQKGISGKAGTSDSEKRAMKRSITIIQGRLNGVYNLRNPNHRKIHRTDGHAADQDEELTHILPLSVEGQVHKMIAEATSKENLVQTYIGWMPWL